MPWLPEILQLNRAQPSSMNGIMNCTHIFFIFSYQHLTEMSDNTTFNSIERDYLESGAWDYPIPEKRMKKEANAINEQFPEANLIEFDSNEKQLGWHVGILKFGKIYEILIVLNRNHPHIPVDIYIVDPDFNVENTPNIDRNGQLIIDNYEWTDKSTAATGIILAASWIEAMDTYFATGEWKFELLEKEKVETTTLSEEEEEE